MQLVNFSMGREEFALPVTTVQEIVRTPTIIEVPSTSPFIKGIINLRNQVLPLIDLHRYLGLGEISKLSRVIVLNDKGKLVGIAVEKVNEVLTIDESHLESSPTPTKWSTTLAKIDDRVLMILDIECFFNSLGKVDFGSSKDSKSSDIDKERLLVCFTIGPEEYALDIMDVREIIKIDKVTFVPGTAKAIVGITNLRGEILPIIDLRLRLNRKVENKKCQRILVVEYEEKRFGFMVDGVNEVLRLSESSIELPPEALQEGDLGGVISGIGKHDGRTIIMVKAGKILEVEK